MAGTRTESAGNATYTFAWTAATAKIDAIADGAAHYLWEHGYGNHETEEVPILYSSLTVTQRIAILNNHLANVLTNAAEAYKSNADQEAARIAAAEYAQNNYGL